MENNTEDINLLFSNLNSLKNSENAKSDGHHFNQTHSTSQNWEKIEKIVDQKISVWNENLDNKKGFLNILNKKCSNF